MHIFVDDSSGSDALCDRKRHDCMVERAIVHR